MLHLKHHMHLPEIKFDMQPPLELEPVLADDDELTLAIGADPIDHDDNWSLDERPDTSQLESFWSEVTDDLKSDPDWTDFAKE